MAAGGAPFAGRTEYELSAAILNAMPAPLPPNVPEGLRTVIERCLAKDAAQRYRNAGEVRAALEALRDSAGSGTPHRPMMAGRWLLRWGVGVLAIAVLVVGAWILVGQPWRMKELKQRQLTSNSPEDPISWGAISPDGKSLVVVDKGGLTLRSVGTGESHAIALPEGLSLTGSLWPVISWFPDGSTLLVSGTSPDGAQVLTSGRDNKIRAWNPANAQQVREIAGFGGEVYRVVVSADGRIFSCSSDKQAREHKVADGAAVRAFAGHNDWVYSVAFNPATKKLATGSWDGEIRIWNADDAKGLVTFTAAPGFTPPTATAAAK
jgi:WD40 repeat protein